MNSTKPQVLSIYRNLLRQCNQTFFQHHSALRKAHQEIRKQFQAKKAINDSKQILISLNNANEAYEYLRASVIQATEKEAGKGNYTAIIRPEHTKPL
jgi:hypothetical protein